MSLYPTTIAAESWSTVPSPRLAHRQRAPALPSQNQTLITQTLLLILCGILVILILYPQIVMDLVDAYMELPSFSDLPLILRDSFRGYARRGIGMQSPLVLRPFAPHNTLTRVDRGLLQSRVSSLWDRNSDLDTPRPEPLSLSDRLKKREWNLEPTQTPKIPGLVNTGNFCFMNSVLQALASLPEFQSYLDSIRDGDDTPVANSLVDLLHHLNTPNPFSTALHPDQVARALMLSDKNRLLATREQQDAQEFFSLLIDTLEAESARQWLMVNKPAGLESLVSLDTSSIPRSPSLSTLSTNEASTANPFEGLSANRMGCLKCKYVENIRHEKLGPMVLPLTMQQPTTLDECLQKEFEMEILEDVECEKCTLLAYRANLLRLVETLPSPSLEIAQSRLAKIDLALKSGKIEDGTLVGGDLKKFIRRSPKTKHHMIARPPSLQAFHIQRSSFQNYTGRALKNQAPVSFPIMLDMSDYVTTSELSMDPEEPISVWKEGGVRTIYRLRSVIVHYGLHNIGHYVAYRQFDGKWFRISDEDVEPATIEEVLKEGARGVFMLMYELVQSGAVEDMDGSKSNVLEVAIEDNDSESETISETTGDAPPQRFSALMKNGVPTPPDSEAEFELVKSKLERIQVSPPSSVGSHSTDDSDQLEQRQTRSTSFSSVHSRPSTPIFGEKDPQTSPPPPKKLRVEIMDLGKVEHISL